MWKVKGSCKACSHRDVCQYCEKYSEYVGLLEETDLFKEIGHYDNVLTLELKCKKYYPDPYYGGTSNTY